MDHQYWIRFCDFVASSPQGASLLERFVVVGNLQPETEILFKYRDLMYDQRV